MTFLLLIVWISTGKKKKMEEVVTFVTYDCLSHFPESLHEAFAPPTDFQNWNKDLNISYSLFFFPWRCSFPRRPKKNDSSFLCNIFFCYRKDRFTFLTTVFQRFGKQLVYFVLQNYHCNKSSCHSLPHIVTIFSLWWGLLKSTLLATIKCRLHY